MATDIQISELNEITVNSDINHIIVNDRESLSDTGITKKIKLENLLTSNIVGESNLSAGAVTCEKIRPLTIDCSRLVCKTITCHQIADQTICNNLIGANVIDNRVLNNDCGFSVKCLTVCNGPVGGVSITAGVDGCLAVESGVTKFNTLRYYWPQSQIANTFLRTDGNGNLTWQEAVPGESTSLVFREIFPVGTIIPWAGTGTTPDANKWLPCNGSTFSNVDWPDLASALGDTWGTHNGSQYYLPDLRGRVPLGSGQSSDTNGTSCNFTIPTAGGSNYGGVYSHKLTSTESGMPSHRHQLGIPRDSHGSGNRLALTDTPNADEGVLFEHFSDYQSANAADYHENIQPYTKVQYIIKAAKDDVQQFNPTVGPGLSAKDATGQTNTITLTSTEVGLNVVSDDFKFDSSGRLQLVDTNYRPGEIIESFSALCNGRDVALKSGTYTMPNVTAYYFVNGGASFVNDLTFYDGNKAASYVRDAANTGDSYDILGSLFRYKLPVNAKRIQYSFTYNWGHSYASSNPLYYITPFIGGGEGTTPADETWTRLLEQAVTPAQYGAYDGQHTQHINLEITDTLAEEDVAKGIIYRGNWGSGGRSLLLNCSLYSTTYPVKLYTNYHQGAVSLTDSVFFTPPFIEIKTYA